MIFFNMRSTEVKARIPNPLIDAIRIQQEQGIIKQDAASRIVIGTYLVQSVWGVSHPFSDRYFDLSLERRDLIDDFILALNQADLIRQKRFQRWLEKKTLAAGDYDSFQKIGRKMMSILEELAEDYHETGQLPDIE
jgi:hypothetical protein